MENRLFAGGRYNINGMYPVRVWDREGRGAGTVVPMTDNSIMSVLPCRDGMIVASRTPHSA